MATDTTSQPDTPLSTPLLDSLLGTAPVVVAFVDPQRRYLAVSEGLAKFHGLPREALVGRPVAEVFPELWPELAPIYTRVFERGETVSNVELQHQRAGEPEPRAWLASYYPVYAEARIIAAGVILVDITERGRAAAGLRESAKRLSYALDAASEGLWDWNLKTGYTYYSPGWIETLGYSPEEVPSHISFWQSILHPDDTARVREQLQAHFEGRTRIYRCELRLRRKSGEYRWDVCRGKVVEWDENGTPLRMIGTDADITERKRAEEALHRLNATLESRVQARTEELAQANRALMARAEELERLLRFKSEFLANMSHELRTPLNSLLILSRLLGDNPEGNLTEGQIQYARTIQASGEDLLQLIDDILDFSKAESGALSLRYEHVAFADVIRAVQRTFRHVAEEKGLDFVIGTSAALPYGMETDPVRLRQILTNLTSNAFKFTERGRVSVNIYPATDAPGAPGTDLIAFEVSDTGIGVAPREREIIFEAFRQGDEGTTRKYGGAGLGLAICQQLASAMGGAITVESEVGKGSTFTAYLPRAQREPRQPPAPPQEDAGAPAGASDSAAKTERASKILVVDDDARNRFSLGAVLQAGGYDALTAESGESALDALARQPDVECVLVDVMMPGMDGYETTRRIRAQPRFRDLPIIAVTAKAMPEDVEKCMDAGCSEYISKPVDTARLMEMIQTLKRK